MEIVLYLFLAVVPCSDNIYAVTIDRYGNVTPRCDNASSIDPWIIWYNDEVETTLPDQPAPQEKQKLVERVFKSKNGALSFYDVAHQDSRKPN